MGRLEQHDGAETTMQEHWLGVAQILRIVQGGHSAQNPSEVMSTLIDAANSTLRAEVPSDTKVPLASESGVVQSCRRQVWDARSSCW